MDLTTHIVGLVMSPACFAGLVVLAPRLAPWATDHIARAGCLNGGSLIRLTGKISLQRGLFRFPG